MTEFEFTATEDTDPKTNGPPKQTLASSSSLQLLSSFSSFFGNSRETAKNIGEKVNNTFDKFEAFTGLGSIVGTHGMLEGWEEEEKKPAAEETNEKSAGSNHFEFEDPNASPETEVVKSVEVQKKAKAVSVFSPALRKVMSNQHADKTVTKAAAADDKPFL